MPGFRLFITKIKIKCVERKRREVVAVEDYILCLKCKSVLLPSHKSISEAQFLNQLQNMDVPFVSKENLVK